jgi:hypothetical protein
MRMTLELTTLEARRLWADFLRRLDWANRDLPGPERDEAKAEAIAHIAEDLAALDMPDEADRLRAALERFGLPPAPPPVWRKPLAIILHYLAIMVMGASGLVILTLLHMALMEALNPAAVGLYIYPGDNVVTLSYENQGGAREILGAWFIPAMLMVSALGSAALYSLWRVALSPTGPVSRWMRP